MLEGEPNISHDTMATLKQDEDVFRLCGLVVDRMATSCTGIDMVESTWNQTAAAVGENVKEGGLNTCNTTISAKHTSLMREIVLDSCGLM